MSSNMVKAISEIKRMRSQRSFTNEITKRAEKFAVTFFGHIDSRFRIKLTAKEWELITPYTVEVTCVIHMNNHIGTEEFVDFTYPGNGSFSVELCSAIAKLYAETYDIHYPVSSVLCAFNEATSKFQIKLNTRIWHRYGYRS